MGTDIADSIAGSYKSQCLGQNFIFTFHTDKQHGHVQGIGTANTYHRLLGTGINCYIFFETVNKLPYTTNECCINTFTKIPLFITDK